jgi:hypothetical protein
MGPAGAVTEPRMRPKLQLFNGYRGAMVELVEPGGVEPPTS